MKLTRRYPKILIISSILIVLVLSAAGPALANRLEDPRAGAYMRPVLFPGSGIEPAIGKRRSYLFRQAYARKGGLDYMKKQLRNEMGGVAGGGVWQRIAH
jgi:hypothetical protein